MSMQCVISSRKDVGLYAGEFGGGLSTLGVSDICLHPNPCGQKNQMRAESEDGQDSRQALLHTKGRGGGDYLDDQGL